jgi:hypothetical protein
MLKLNFKLEFTIKNKLNYYVRTYQEMDLRSSSILEKVFIYNIVLLCAKGL